MNFERTMVYSLYTPYSIYFGMVMKGSDGLYIRSSGRG